MYAICFYAPTADADAVKEAMFAAGAGHIGHYDRCCWQTDGHGQFRPLPGSHPAIGDAGHDTRVPETRVEMVCDDEHLQDAIAALCRAHPYETPAFHYWPVNQPPPPPSHAPGL